MSESLAVGTEPPGGVDYGSFEFKVKRHTLHLLVESAMAAVPSGAALPVMASFQVRVSPESIRVAAADTQVTILAQSPAVSTADTAEVYIPAKRLQAILKESPEGDVTLTGKKNLLTVVAAGGGASSSWVLKLPSPDGYPLLPDPAAIKFESVSREKFLAALKQVHHAVCRNAGQPAYTQVRIAKAQLPGGQEGMAATASDSVRLARAPLPGFPVPMSIPAAGLDYLTKLLASTPAEEAGVGETEEVVAFRVGPVVLTLKHQHAEFPDVDNLVIKPASANQDVLSVDRDELLAAIRRVRINADPSTSAVALVATSEHSSGQLTVVARDRDKNSASETLHATWEGGERVVVVNHQALADMLSVHSSGPCDFRLGKNMGKRLAPVLLSDAEAGTTGVIPAMLQSLVGY